jgi:hypothetical protein
MDFPILIMTLVNYKGRGQSLYGFQQLKHILTNAPILKIVGLEKDFLVCNYA